MFLLLLKIGITASLVLSARGAASAAECAFVTSATLENPSLIAIELGTAPVVKTLALPVQGAIALTAGKVFATVLRTDDGENIVETGPASWQCSELGLVISCHLPGGDHGWALLQEGTRR